MRLAQLTQMIDSLTNYHRIERGVSMGGSELSCGLKAQPWQVAAVNPVSQTRWTCENLQRGSNYHKNNKTLTEQAGILIELPTVQPQDSDSDSASVSARLRVLIKS